MLYIRPEMHKALLAVSSVPICFGGAILACVVGMAYALHWPLSEPNFQAAVIFGVIFGFFGCGVTMSIILTVRPTIAAFALPIGGTLTVLISGAATFLLAAGSAAC